MFRTLSNGTQVNVVTLSMWAFIHISLGLSALIASFPYYRKDFAELAVNRAVLAVFWFVASVAMTAFGIFIVCFLVGWVNV